MATRVAIIFYSATGTTLKMARAMAASAEAAGAEVRLRRVRELAPESAIQQNPKWAATHQEMHSIPEASNDDLEWADALIFGTPTRYGLPTAQLKEFLDGTGSLWAQGKLGNKFVTSFTTTATQHGGHETTIVALNNTFYHWGCIIVPPGYTDPAQFATGTPYGTTFVSQNAEREPDEPTLTAARYQAKRLVEIASQFLASA